MQPVRIRDGHDNNWTVLRVAMALAVLVGHAMIIGERDILAEPMVYGDYSISYMAVNAFFIASGFLVTGSMMYRKDIGNFASARALRIYPALIVHVVVVMLVVGLANTTLPFWQYLAHPEVWLQIPRVLTFADTDFILPGVFEGNYEQLASAPLWTLRYEVLAYLATGLVFSIGLTRHKWMLAVPFVAAAIAWPLVHMLGLYEPLPATVKNMLRFALPYGLGALIWAYREDMPFRPLLLPIVLLAAYVGRDTVMAEMIMNIAVAYGLFILAYAPYRLPGRDVSDISYGVYIWHWPILQWAAAKQPDWGVMELMAVGLVGTLIVATASWHWVEKPMLAKKGELAAFFKRKKIAPA